MQMGLSQLEKGSIQIMHTQSLVESLEPFFYRFKNSARTSANDESLSCVPECSVI